MSARRLTLLQLNDLHGYVDPHQEVFRSQNGRAYRIAGGLARIATIFERVRAETAGAVLALDNGDTFHGTFAAVHSKGRALVPAMNALGFAAMTAHWEFAYGPEEFRALARELTYPVLAINCYHSDTETLAFPPYRLVECGGLKVGIIGIAATIVDKSMPASYSKGLRFSLGNEELPGYIAQLRNNERVDLIVVLSHLGLPQDAKLAREVSGIDVIVSGHTHNRLYQPLEVGRTTIFQSGCHGSFVGRLDLEMEGGVIVRRQHQLIPVDENVPPDREMAALVATAVGPYRGMLAEVVGRAGQPLDRASVLEGSMDAVLLDAIATAAETRLAFSNGWRYGAPIVPGPVTLEHLWNMVPTNAPVAIVRLRGEEIVAMLEENLERTFSSDPYRQMGGFVKRCRDMHMYFKVENPPGHRIEELYVEGAPIEAARIYTAALLGEQAVPHKYGHGRENIGVNAVDALRRHFSLADSIEPSYRPSVSAI